MPGGLMNLISQGSQNIILTGNPTKTFFKTTYNKYTNFGMQKFRIDYDGLRVLNYAEESVFKFKVPRYADLINDVYVVVNLPNIWSSVYIPTDASNNLIQARPYEFKWIDDLGTNMIKKITISIGGQVITEYSGEFINFIKERDFDEAKKSIFNKMTGNVKELNDPANANGRTNQYPTAYWYNKGSNYNASITHQQEEPSIRGRQLFIPIEAWFCQTSKMAFPLVALQYSEMQIEVTFRPVYEMYSVRNVANSSSFNSATTCPPELLYVAPTVTDDVSSIYRFLNPPSTPPTGATTVINNVYDDRRTDWNADVHLIANYIFLDEQEREVFAKNDQQYLIRVPYETEIFDTTGSQLIEFQSRDLVPDYMWRFRRNDSFLRNVWSNYTNYEYNEAPDLIPVIGTCDGADYYVYYSTGNLNITKKKDVLQDLAIIMDGKYRENLLNAGVYNYVEKYARTTGDAKDGLYIYSFALNSNVRDLQPSGAMYMNKYNKIAFEFNTITPPVDPSGNYQLLCDGGTLLGVRQEIKQLYSYTFDLKIAEERYNVLMFTSGMADLMWSR